MDEATERSAFMSYFDECTTFNGNAFDVMVPRVFTYGLKYGLEDQDMLTITKFALGGRLSFIRIKKLLRCLIPRIYVSNEVTELVVLYLFKCFDENEIPTTLNYILHWLTGILQYKLIITKQCIHKYYPKFYKLFNSELIAVSACKLVYLLTSPEDINKNNAEFVMQLHSIHKSRDRNHFGVLLRLFKCYKPSMVPIPVSYYSVNKNFGTISSGINHSLLTATVRISNNYRIVRRLNVLLWGKKFYQQVVLKRTEIHLIPKIEGNKITNRDIQKLIISGVVLKTLYNYDSEPSPEIPTSILSLINNPRSRYLLANADEIVQIRFCIELVVVLKDAFFFRKNIITYYTREMLLMKISAFQNELAQGIPTVTEFIQEYMRTWDGFEHQIDILNIIEWLHISSFASIYETILLKFRENFKIRSVSSKCAYLICLGNLIVNTMSSQAREKNGEKALFIKEKVDLDFALLTRDLLKFLNSVCIQGIVREGGTHMIMKTINTVYAKIFVAGNEIFVGTMPANSIDYWCIFLSDCHVLLRIAQIQKDDYNV